MLVKSSTGFSSRIADRGSHQAIGVGRGGWHRNLQARRVSEPGFEVVVVLSADPPAAAGMSQHHHRKGELPAREEAQLAGRVHDFVCRVAEERREEQVDNRPESDRSGAGGSAGDEPLGERRVPYPIGAELGFEGDALGADALAKDQDGRVGAHLGRDRVVHGHHGHWEVLRHRHGW